MLEKRIAWALMSGLVAMAGFAACGGDDEATTEGTAGTGGATGSDGSIVEEAGTLHGLAIVNPACGTGDGGVDDDCITCASTSCVPEYQACFDSGWQTSLVGGVCADFGQCVTDCGCGDNTCFKGCVATIESDTANACYDCLTNLFTCEQNNCASECAEPVDDDAGVEDGSPIDSGGGNDGGKPDH
jgi:hypothetical protein